MREELAVRVELVRCVWHADLRDSETTLWGWRAELVAPEPTNNRSELTNNRFEPTPNPAEVSEVLWLTPEEVVQHPDALASTAPFLDALLRSERMARATGTG